MTFPILKTGAVAQYPIAKTAEFANQRLRFVDGGEQRYRDSAGPLHKWSVRLDALDETELAAVEEFFLEQSGAFGEFAFRDPWDGTEYPSCSLADDDATFAFVAEMRGATRLTIVENRQ